MFFSNFFAIISTQLLTISLAGTFPWNWFLVIEPISLAAERKIHLWYVYVLNKIWGNFMWPSCSEQKCTCRLVVLPSKLIAFLMSLLLMPLLLLQLPFLIWRVTTYGKIQNVFVNSESTGYYENDPVLVGGIIIKCNEAFVTEWKHDNF